MSKFERIWKPSIVARWRYWMINILRILQLPGSERTIFTMRHEMRGENTFPFFRVAFYNRPGLEILRCLLRGNYFRYFQLSQQCRDLIEIVGTLARARYFHLSSLDYDFSCRHRSFLYIITRLSNRDNEINV